MTLRNNAPLSYLEVEYWTDRRWHGVCYRHKPLPGGSDIPRYLLHVTTDGGYADPREAATAIMKVFPDLPSPLEGLTDADINAQMQDVQNRHRTK